MNMKKKYLNTHEAAGELGISKQTLLRYENRGIFPKPKRNLINKWREYTAADVYTLRSILGRS